MVELHPHKYPTIHMYVILDRVPPNLKIKINTSVDLVVPMVFLVTVQNVIKSHVYLGAYSWTFSHGIHTSRY